MPKRWSSCQTPSIRTRSRSSRCASVPTSTTSSPSRSASTTAKPVSSAAKRSRRTTTSSVERRCRARRRSSADRPYNARRADSTRTRVSVQLRRKDVTGTTSGMTGPTSTTSRARSTRGCARTSSAGVRGRRCAAVGAAAERGVRASRHAVREALKRLQQAGLVSISQGGATRVRDWRHHGGLELLLEGELPEALHAPRAAMEMRACIGADAARRCARAGRTSRCKAQIIARAEQLAARRGPRGAQRALRGAVGPDRRRARTTSPTGSR